MSGNDLDFKMRLEAETKTFTQNIRAALQEMERLNQAARDLDKTGDDKGEGLKTLQAQAAAVRDTLRQSEAAAKTIAQALRVKTQAERDADKAAKERARAEKEAARQAQQAAREQAQTAQQTAAAARAGRDYVNGLHKALGVRPRNEILNEIARTKQALQSLKNAGAIPKAEFKRLQAAYKSQLQSLNAELGKLPKTNLKPLAASIGGIGTAALASVASVGALTGGLAAVLNTTREFQAIRKRFDYAFGGAQAGAAQMAFVREEAARLGLELTGAANGYAQLASATKELNISQTQTQQIFKGVASAAAAMGLGAEEANGVFLALSQIAGKGKVSMEELRGQLGERLTPAMAIAAKSMGVTTAELEKMVESGLSAEEFLPKFGAALEEAFGEEAAKNAETLGGQINLLQNRFKEFLNGLGEGGIADAAVSVMKEVGAAIDWVEEKIANLDGAVKDGAAEGFRQLYETLKELWQAAGDLFGTLFETVSDLGAAIGGLAGSAEEDFDLLRGVFDGLNIAIGVFRDGLSGLHIIWEGLAGSLLKGLSWLVKAFETLFPSHKLAKFGHELSEAAEKHFNKMHELAVNFESKTAAAIEKAGERRIANDKKVLAEQERQFNAAQDALVEKAAAHYREMAELAERAARQSVEAEKAAKAAIGTLAEKSAAKQAQIAKKQAADAKAAADEAGKAWYEAMGGQMPAVLSATDKALKEAQASAQSLGLDLRAAMNTATPEMTKTLEQIGKLRAGLDELAASGADTGRVLREAMGKAVSAAANEADIAAVKALFKELGEEGRLSMREVERGILAADLRLQELKGNIDPAAAAFKKLGIESKEAMRLSAEETRLAFETVKQSGQATGEGLKQAFAKAADALLQTGDAAQRRWVENQAAAYGYKVAVDETGKAALQAAAETKKATDEQAKGHEKAAEAAREQAQATAQTAKQSTDAAEQSTQSVKRYTRVLNDLGQAVTEVLDRNFFFGTSLWPTIIRRLEDTIIAANRATKELNAEMERGGDIAVALARAEAMAVTEARQLDKATLDNLNAAIDKARQKMKQLAEEAKQTREDLQATLAELNGDNEASARLAQQRKLKELAAKRDAAKRTGNRQAAADYEQSIALQQQIWQRQQDKKAAEAAQRQREAEERARAEAERREQEARREAERERQEREREAERRRQEQSKPLDFRLPEVQVPNVNVDLEKLVQALRERDENVANLAGGKILEQLEAAMKRKF